ncbi:unnamed protein product [Amoebophrya sp. A120]|nr:unnamed protein product [Amoebophrya sp. A120]|eukprot:GSA120T00025716001.1
MTSAIVCQISILVDLTRIVILRLKLFSTDFASVDRFTTSTLYTQRFFISTRYTPEEEARDKLTTLNFRRNVFEDAQVSGAVFRHLALQRPNKYLFYNRKSIRLELKRTVLFSKKSKIACPSPRTTAT